MGGRANWPGRVGVAAGVLLWAGSIPVLALVMWANEMAARQPRMRVHAASGSSPGHLYAVAVAGGVGFVALQIASVLALAFALRAAYRLRTAVCFTIGAGLPLLLDGLGLFALLVWLRLALGAG